MSGTHHQALAAGRDMKATRSGWVGSAVALLAACSAPAFAQGAASEGLDERVQTVQLSRGAELRLVVSKRQSTSPKTAVLLFAGYPGVLKVRAEGGAPAFALGGNFLLRARRFLNTDRLFTVLVDCPVDKWEACEDEYRTSPEHVADIADVVAAVKAETGATAVYLAGTSYGTVSTSFLAQGLGGKVDGVVHTATFTDPRTSGRHRHGAAMANFDWSKATVPQLFVHHKDDPCELTRYASVVQRRKDLPLITVEGAKDPRGEACLAFTAHGFVGRERAVMAAIRDWITERKVTATVSAD